MVLEWKTRVLVLRHKIADSTVFPAGLKRAGIAARSEGPPEGLLLMVLLSQSGD